MTPYPTSEIKRKPSGSACSACVLGGCSDGRVFGRGFFTPDGAQRLGVMIVGEALSHHDAVQEKALVGNSGFLLGKAMSRRGWSRDDFRYASVMSCEPSEDLAHKSGALKPWAEAALRHCRQYLDTEIRRAQPRAILALGDTAFRALTGVELPMMAARGYVFEALGHPGVMVVPTFHPQYIIRGNPHLTQTLIWDMEKAVKVAAGWPGYEVFDCLMDPTVSKWEAYVAEAEAAARSGVPLALDIETPFKRKQDMTDKEKAEEDITYNIDRISFAFEAHRGASVPWAMPWLPGVQRLLRVIEDAPAAMAIIWNRSYDRPRVVKATQIPMPIERTRDSMDAFHVLFNALPKKLGFATACLPHAWRIPAWKHKSKSDPALYSVMDAIALWRNDRDILRLLEETGQLDVYNLICRDLDPTLEHMSLKGMTVDLTKRDVLESDLLKILAESKRKMTAVVPREILRQQVWKGRDAAERGLQRLIADGDSLPEASLIEIPTTRKAKLCAVCGVEGAAHTKRKTLPPVAAADTAVAEAPASEGVA